jgi:hypothetical protein
MTPDQINALGAFAPLKIVSTPNGFTVATMSGHFDGATLDGALEAAATALVPPPPPPPEAAPENTDAPPAPNPEEPS